MLENAHNIACATRTYLSPVLPIVRTKLIKVSRKVSRKISRVGAVHPEKRPPLRVKVKALVGFRPTATNNNGILMLLRRMFVYPLGLLCHFSRIVLLIS